MARRIKKLPTPDLSQPVGPKLLGEAIKAKRTQSNLRLEDAAALCGVAKETFHRIEHGQGTSSVDNVLRICDSLGITLYIKPWQENEEVGDVWK
ncbi:MAG: helix-turn-helix domain-containing protein [Gammaproteobacteria bacterium]|nr:helix-turn-helix domain-containing protein [Gammaproteobacteria bacterium]